jgi:8-oxo-dGTP pyrophosphatase MutT (NUDIX family)
MSMRGLFEKPKSYSVSLPFDNITARAVIVRRRDGALLGVLHRQDGKYAPPGGHMDEGESPDLTLLRELEEERIRLIDMDEGWRANMVVDYFDGYRTLNIWYVVIVEDAQIGYSEEAVETRWLDQSQDLWYPLMREKILFAVQQYAPEYTRLRVGLLETW